MRRLRSRRPGVAVAVVFTALAGLSAAACADLFHDTDFPDECDLDADAPGCADSGMITHADAGHDASAADASTKDASQTDSAPPPVVIGPSDPLCTADSTMAAERVQHACAYLSACGGSLGINAPSACMTAARMVYDCSVAPTRPTIGPAGTFWRCIANATSCDAITACIEPGGGESCQSGATYVACDNAATDDPAENVASRISCDERVSTPTGIENCSASGHACLSSDGTCSVATGTACTTGCTGTVLHSCDDAGVDQGIDCASFGAGTCAFDSASGAIGCTAVGTACTASSDVTCDGNGFAHGCPSGVAEAVDCPTLTGIPGSAACTAPATGTGGASGWDVSRACTAGTACTEQCGAGGIITACVLGQPATLDCSAAGVSSCLLTSVAGATHAACGS